MKRRECDLGSVCPCTRTVTVGCCLYLNCSCSTGEENSWQQLPAGTWYSQVPCNDGKFNTRVTPPPLVTCFLWLRRAESEGWGARQTQGSQLPSLHAALPRSPLLGCIPLRHLQGGDGTCNRHQHQSASTSSEHFHWQNPPTPPSTQGVFFNGYIQMFFPALRLLQAQTNWWLWKLTRNKIAHKW